MHLIRGAEEIRRGYAWLAKELVARWVWIQSVGPYTIMVIREAPKSKRRKRKRI